MSSTVIRAIQTSVIQWGSSDPTEKLSEDFQNQNSTAVKFKTQLQERFQSEYKPEVIDISDDETEIENSNPKTLKAVKSSPNYFETYLTGKRIQVKFPELTQKPPFVPKSMLFRRSPPPPRIYRSRLSIFYGFQFANLSDDFFQFHWLSYGYPIALLREVEDTFWAEPYANILFLRNRLLRLFKLSVPDATLREMFQERRDYFRLKNPNFVAIDFRVARFRTFAERLRPAQEWKFDIEDGWTKMMAQIWACSAGSKESGTQNSQNPNPNQYPDASLSCNLIDYSNIKITRFNSQGLLPIGFSMPTEMYFYKLRLQKLQKQLLRAKAAAQKPPNQSRVLNYRRSKGFGGLRLSLYHCQHRTCSLLEMGRMPAP